MKVVSVIVVFIVSLFLCTVSLWVSSLKLMSLLLLSFSLVFLAHVDADVVVVFFGWRYRARAKTPFKKAPSQCTRAVPSEKIKIEPKPWYLTGFRMPESQTEH